MTPRVLFITLFAASLVLLLAPVETEAATAAGPAFTDELVHIVIFAALMASGTRAFADDGRVAVGLVAYAVATEALQGAIPHRSAQWGDVVADVVGIALGWLVGRLKRDSS